MFDDSDSVYYSICQIRAKLKNTVMTPMKTTI